MRKAVIIDVYSHGSYHEVINQAYLMMVASMYDRVDYIADGTACDNLSTLLVKCNARLGNVNFIKKDFSIKKNKLAKLLQISWLNYEYYIRQDKDTDIFYNNNLFGATWLINRFPLCHRNNLYVMCHAEMELIDKRQGYTRARSVSSLYLRYVFNRVKLSEKFHFILLSPRMVDCFKSMTTPLNHDRLAWIDHAYIRPENPKRDLGLDGGETRLGIPGLVNESRGLTELNRLLATTANDRIHIYAISMVQGRVVDSRKFTEVNRTGKLMPASEYSNWIKNMDYVLFLYPPGSYKLTASGAALEAIWNLKPIIALRNNYFDYLFNKFGQIGILADNTEQLISAIDRLERKDTAKYTANLARARRQLMPDNVAGQLKAIIECQA